MAGFLGMRATDDFATDQRPKNFRQLILLEFPNGSAGMTALNSLGQSESVDDPEFSYWSKNLAKQSGAVTAGEIWKEADLATQWGSGHTTTDGDTNIYVQVAVAVANEFRAGHTVSITTTATPSQTTFGKVLGVVKNGASSTINVKCLKTDAAAGYLLTADVISIVGNINPEGGAIPEAITYDPDKFTNYTQIFRTPLDVSRTAQKTHLRTGDVYTELKREIMLYHGVEIEKGTIFGEKSENAGSNGKPERSMQGIISFIKENVSANVSHFPTDETASTWIQAGEEWLESKFELVFRRGSREKVAWTGSGGLLGIQKLVKSSTHFHINSEVTAYGLEVNRWRTPFGTINLMVHPLLTDMGHTANDMIIHEPKNMKYRYITDTVFKKDKSQDEGGSLGIDGKKEEFLTECSYEYHFANSMMYLTGVGSDGATSG